MTFLANENFPMPSIYVLRQNGFEVISIKEILPGVSDTQVIDRATTDKNIILTFDKDYGEIIVRHGITNPPAVVYFRYKGEDPEFAGKILSELLLKDKIQLENNFTVIEKNNIRQRHY